MGTWGAQVGKLTVSGDGYGIFTAFDLQTGSLYSLNAIDSTNSFAVEIAQDVELKLAADENTASDVISVECDNSVTVETPKRKKIIDGLDGNEKAASAAAAIESIKITILDSSAETLEKLQNIRSKPVALTVGLGKSPAGISRGHARILGKRGEITRKTSSNNVTSIEVTISGGLTYDKTGGTVTYSAFNSAISDPTPVGEATTIAIADLTSGQFDSLLAGDVILH